MSIAVQIRRSRKANPVIYPKKSDLRIDGPRFSAIAGAVSLALASALTHAQSAPPAPASAPALPTADGQLTEVVVTAQRRTENAQDVPISMQVMTSDTLKQLNVSTFDDYLKYLPNVSAASNGPGQNEVFMRGLSTGSGAGDASGSQGLWPNVAIYLDDESVQLPYHNLDVYAFDLERVEVLEGPQGTLFGSGAEAGVIRYITNKPKLDVTEGDVKAGYGVTAHGDPNTDVAAVLNLPLIEDHMAVRAVVYSDRRGGYIDNVPATFTRKDTDIGIHYANYPAVNGQCPDGGANNGFCVPPGTPSINNYNIAANDINPVTYQGIRAELLYKFNDDWDLLISQSYQNMDAQGVFYQQPYASDGAALAPLQVTLFNPASDEDKFENTAWTLDGKLGPLKAIYTGGYLDRNVDQTADYTNYARAVYADYYQCYGPGTGGNSNLSPTCYSPSATWRDLEHDTHLQHEVRLSTPDDWRLRGLVGVYYADDTVVDVTTWNYKSIPACTSNAPSGSPGDDACLSDIGTLPGTTDEYPGIKGDNSAYYFDVNRETKQIAGYVSADFDIIPKVLTLTAGTRYFRFRNSFVGDATSSFGCFQAGLPADGCTAVGYNLDAQGLKDTESGFKSRGTLTWHVTSDVMLYYTYSQGYRPGAFNLNGSTLHAPGPDGVDQYLIPKAYNPDQLTNNEVGWKTILLNHHLEWNGAIYHEAWDNVQIPFFNPGVTGDLFYNTNGQNFTIKGIETSLIARPFTGLEVQGAVSFNSSRQTNSPALIDNNPVSSNYGKPITEVCNPTCTAVVNPFGPVGSPSANSPPMQLSARIRYDWVMGQYSAYAQVGATHTDHSFNQAGSNPTYEPGIPIFTARLRFENPAYSTYTASLGVSRDRWDVDVYGENLSNSNASTSTSSQQYVVTETPIRPRVIGVEFGYHF